MNNKVKELIKIYLKVFILAVITVIALFINQIIGHMIMGMTFMWIKTLKIN